MSSLDIKLMLHFYAICEPYSGPEAGSRAFDESIAFLSCYEMIEPCEYGYRATEGGAMYVDALKAVPFPERRWVMPLAAHSTHPSTSESASHVQPRP